MGATSIETSGLAAVTIADGTSVGQLESAYDIVFRQRLCLVGSLVAIAVLHETGGTTSRTNYARQFLANPVTLVENSVSFAVPADGVTGSSLTDQDIANRIGDLWNILSAVLTEMPTRAEFVAALEAWRAVPRQEQISRMGSLSADRPPPDPGGRAAVGLWCPCLLDGGAETWQLTVARSVDHSLVCWQGCCAVGGMGIAQQHAASAISAMMPLSAGIAEARALAARCDVIVTWAGVDPAPILEGLEHRPRVVYAVHMPAAGYSGRLPVPIGSVDRFVAVSDLALDAVPDRRGEVIWNAVDPDRLAVRRDRAEMHRAWGIPEGSPVAGYLGRLSHEKDPHAMARLARSLPDRWRVVVVGEGPMRADLLRDRPPNLHVVGPDPRAGDVLNALDVLVVPSHYESFGLTIGEGLWIGCPVVCTEVGIAKMAPGLTWPIRVGASGGEIADAIIGDRRASTHQRQRVDLGRQWAREKLSMDRFGREWTSLLVGLADAAKAARVARCPERGGVLPISLQDDCGCAGRELSECRAGKGKVPGRVTLRDCLDCRSSLLARAETCATVVA